MSDSNDLISDLMCSGRELGGGGGGGVGGRAGGWRWGERSESATAERKKKM